MAEAEKTKAKNDSAGRRNVNNYRNNSPRNKNNAVNKSKKRNYPNTRPTTVFGAIDLGTNNCRLLVARPQGKGFRVVDAFSRVVALGEGLGRDGRISDAAMDRTISALRVCVEKMERRGVTQMRNVATQACREAKNCDEFLMRVEKEVRIKLDIIEPEEEARLAVIGCKALLDNKYSHAVVFDIGGGSTELIWLKIGANKQPKIIDWTSIPYGVVNLSEAFDSKDQISPENYKKMKDQISKKVSAFGRKNSIKSVVGQGRVQLLGSSGTVTTLTSVHLGLPQYDRSQVDGAWVTSDQMFEICHEVSELSYEGRVKKNSIGESRAELVVAGCAILEVIMEQMPAKNICVADRGIREGMLLELMEDRMRKKNTKRKRPPRNYRKKNPKIEPTNQEAKDNTPKPKDIA